MKKFSSLFVVLLLMLASFTAGIEYPRGDVNYDGRADMDDLTCLINYLLNGTWPEDPVTPQTQTFTVNGVSFTMVAVEGGTFMMGATAEQGDDDYSNEKPVHQVTLSSYSIGQTEVTQALWQAVMGSNPSQITGNMSHPVEKVSWNDCQTFIARLNELTGEHFRLPTEAEWEFAARGGNLSQGYKYAGSDNIDDVAWYRVNAYDVGSSSPDYGTHPVATKAPNELGLYDMSGNVFELCQDYYGSYSSEAQTNPTGADSTSLHVMRGGSWNLATSYSRVSFRGNCGSFYADVRLGLRLVLSDESEQEEQHEYVDLGLPSGTLWATCNVGATAPEEYGDYFAWGETEPKEEYTWESYQWCNGSDTTLTKYCTNIIWGYQDFTDGKVELDPEDDAAYANWGSSWRMPTVEQLNELIDNCSWTWTARNGVYGRLFTGPNGNTLFLPAAGHLGNNMLRSANTDGLYWTRSLGNTGAYYALALSFYSGGKQWWNIRRNCGLSVRAVRVP